MWQCHNARKVFKNKNVDVITSPRSNAFCVLSDKLIWAHFMYFNIKTHVQKARESYDLNMGFRSLDYGFKLLCVTNCMQDSIDCL